MTSTQRLVNIIMSGILAIAVALIVTAAPQPTRASIIEHARSIPWQLSNYETPKTDEQPDLLHMLAVRAATFGLTISMVPLGDLGEGLSDFRRGQIYLNDALSIDGSVEILAHELAHFFQPPTIGGKGLSDPSAEVFADLVAFEVCLFYGYDISERTARYLSLYKSGLDDMTDLQTDITFAVEVITGQRAFQPNFILFQPAQKSLAAENPTVIP